MIKMIPKKKWAIDCKKLSDILKRSTNFFDFVKSLSIYLLKMNDLMSL